MSRTAPTAASSPGSRARWRRVRGSRGTSMILGIGGIPQEVRAIIDLVQTIMLRGIDESQPRPVRQAGDVPQWHPIGVTGIEQRRPCSRVLRIANIDGQVVIPLTFHRRQESRCRWERIVPNTSNWKVTFL